MHTYIHNDSSGEAGLAVDEEGDDFRCIEELLDRTI